MCTFFLGTMFVVLYPIMLQPRRKFLLQAFVMYGTFFILIYSYANGKCQNASFQPIPYFTLIQQNTGTCTDSFEVVLK